jgi:GNAT superfamily N-acetyltransferase
MLKAGPSGLALSMRRLEMVMTLAKNLCNYRQETLLLDGRKIIIRSICSADKKGLLEFHKHLSEDTRFLRYQYLKGDLTEGDLKNFCDVDYNNTLALVAETEREEGRTQIIGVGRYYRLPVFHTAEVAFVVRDSEQGKGVGTQLLRYLAELAWQNDIRYFVAEVLRVNGKMLSIFRKSDPNLKHVADDDSTCTVTLSVAETIDRTPSD